MYNELLTNITAQCPGMAKEKILYITSKMWSATDYMTSKQWSPNHFFPSPVFVLGL